MAKSAWAIDREKSGFNILYEDENYRIFLNPSGEPFIEASCGRHEGIGLRFRLTTGDGITFTTHGGVLEPFAKANMVEWCLHRRN